MNETSGHRTSRREFFKTAGQAAAVTALAGGAISNVHATEKNNLNDSDDGSVIDW